MTDARISLASPGIRVNVGCGVTPTAGWLNFDNSLSVRVARWAPVSSILARLHIADPASAGLIDMAQSGLVRFANAATHIPCASGSVAVVYSSHMIEHLDRNEARAFLAEVKRILRPGGMVRLAAPDLSRLVQSYVTTGNADDFVAGTHMGLSRPSGVRARLRWAVTGPRHHLWMYDGESLSRLVRDAGFLDVAVRPAGTTGIPDPGPLDLMERADESVYVEGARPA